MPGGISVYLHQVSPAAAPPNLSPPQRAGALPPVAVELHYLLTAWGDTPAVQQRLLGWCLRSLHDVPVLVASALNIAGGDAEIFHPDETVELVWEPSGAWPLGDTGPASLNLPPSLRFRARSVAIDQVPPG